MTYRVACLYAGLVVVVSGSLVSVLAAPQPSAVRHDPAPLHPHVLPDANILVNDVARPRYAHDGRFYVEAIKGREYAIQLKNPYAVRVAVALSVDGLNTIDARETTAGDARKWVIAPYDTITIRGWQTSHSEARRFEFTTEARSYGQALGKTANLGVITAAFFRERTVPPVMTNIAPERDEPGRQSSDREEAKNAMPAAAPPSEGAAKAAPDAAARTRVDEFAATGMGRGIGHIVHEVRLDLEEAPAHTVNIRYEFRPQLVQLGILPAERPADPLTRREGARGFESGFSPVP